MCAQVKVCFCVWGERGAGGRERGGGEGELGGGGMESVTLSREEVKTEKRVSAAAGNEPFLYCARTAMVQAGPAMQPAAAPPDLSTLPQRTHAAPTAVGGRRVMGGVDRLAWRRATQWADAACSVRAVDVIAGAVQRCSG